VTSKYDRQRGTAGRQVESKSHTRKHCDVYVELVSKSSKVSHRATVNGPPPTARPAAAGPVATAVPRGPPTAALRGESEPTHRRPAPSDIDAAAGFQSAALSDVLQRFRQRGAYYVASGGGVDAWIDRRAICVRAAISHCTRVTFKCAQRRTLGNSTFSDRDNRPSVPAGCPL